MKEITHRQLRNDSADILRRVAVGETILVTNNGLSADRHLVASWLLHTEMHCAAGRHPDDVDSGEVQNVLNAVNLADLTRGDMIAAGTLTPLRSNDAIHLAVARRLGADEIITYDAELTEAARTAGLSIFAPR